MRLRANKGGHGHVTSYMLSLGSAEARRLGFVTPDGERLELEKIIDETNRQLIVRIKQSAPETPGT